MRRRGQSGFALLLVFLMAAVIAITLYMQIPRLAFQAQRQKEQLLIERGEQYKRAIQLFYRANNRYPAELKDLENFNNRRFLRHKFLDPMTGKDDWRLVHINNGVLTDSVLNKQKKDDANQPASTAGQYVGEQAPIGATQNPGQPAQNPMFLRRRASEGGAGVPAVGPNGEPISPDATGQPGQPQAPGMPPFPGQSQAGATPPFPGQPQIQPQPGADGQAEPPAQPQLYPNGRQPFYPSVQPQPYSGAQPFPGAVGNVQPNAGAPIPPEVANMPGGFNGAAPQPFPGVPTPGQIPGRQAGAQPFGGQPNPASPSQPYVGGGQPYVGSSQPYVGGGSYIGSQATPGGPNPTPFSPGGVNPTPFTPPIANPLPNPGQPNFQATPGGAQAPAGFPQPGAGPNPAANFINNMLTNPRANPVGPQPQGQQIGGGIAGIASKSESPAIMVYNDRTNYNEWEFIFDPTKQQTLQNPNAATIGTPAQNLGSSPAAQTPGAGPSTPGFGNGPGIPGFGGQGAPGFAGPGAPGFAGPGAPSAPGNSANPGAATPGAGQTSQLPTNIRPGRP
ncbi:MAG: hypothetical protein LAP40_12050 [Acidobacteriia bacterium]|nr:hypothetical protein [Terriglobia bacterium]